jgi:hypothetical protein
MSKLGSIFQRFKILLLMFFLILIQLISISTANGQDDFDDTAINIGWFAVALFSITVIYVIFYQLFINSRKILPKNDKYDSRREKIKKTYLKVKKPLSYVHYIAPVTAFIILLFHGSILIWNNTEKTIIGLIAGSFYLLYVILGFLIKVVLKKSKKFLKVRKNLFKLHTQLIILVIVGSITIAHLAI